MSVGCNIWFAKDDISLYNNNMKDLWETEDL